MIRSEAKASLARKLDINLSTISQNDLFTEADLEDFIDTGLKRSWDYKPWTFKEKTYQTLATADDYYDYPADFEDESIQRLSLGGVEFGKRNFDDYRTYFNSYPSDNRQLWSDHGRFYFINRNASSIGATILVTGLLRAPTLTSDSDLLPFSPSTDNQESSGNKAIIQLAYAEALGSEKLKNHAQATIERREAYATLDILWKPMGERRSREQSQNRPFFNDIPDYFGSGGWSNKNNIANFY